MLKNYLKIAVRNLLKHKTFSIINIAGLAVGMTACLLIVLYVWDELSFEDQHEKADRIYRLNCEYFLPKNAGSEAYAVTGPGVAPLIAKDYPEIESVVRIRNLGIISLKNRIQQNNFTRTLFLPIRRFLTSLRFRWLTGTLWPLWPIPSRWSFRKLWQESTSAVRTSLEKF